jgi:hypothetical protein
MMLLPLDRRRQFQKVFLLAGQQYAARAIKANRTRRLLLLHLEAERGIFARDQSEAEFQFDLIHLPSRLFPKCLPGVARRQLACPENGVRELTQLLPSRACLDLPFWQEHRRDQIAQSFLVPEDCQLCRVVLKPLLRLLGQLRIADLAPSSHAAGKLHADQRLNAFRDSCCISVRLFLGG